MLLYTPFVVAYMCGWFRSISYTLFWKSRLKRATNDSIQLFSLQNQSFHAKVVDVYDGDTCSIVIQDNCRLRKFRVRCAGYDSPEMKPPKTLVNREDVIRKAILARNYFVSKVTNCAINTQYLYTKPEMQSILHTNTKLVQIACGGWDKYGRLLADFYVDGDHINADMIAHNHGYPYDGKTKLVDGDKIGDKDGVGSGV